MHRGGKRKIGWLSARPGRSVRRPLGHSFPIPVVGRPDKKLNAAYSHTHTSLQPLNHQRLWCTTSRSQKKKMKLAAVLFAFCLCFVAVTLATDNLQERTGYSTLPPHHTTTPPPQHPPSLPFLRHIQNHRCACYGRGGLDCKRGHCTSSPSSGLHPPLEFSLCCIPFCSQVPTTQKVVTVSSTSSASSLSPFYFAW